jgi:prepilin-type N-terminal cleavage/methylation domain-containing protein
MNHKGLTLIELLIAMVIVSALVGGIYRTFISQQHTYVVQEQVVDMQQNLRMAINQMVREIRMAGFGHQGKQTDPFWGAGGGMYGKYNNVVTPSGDGKSVTVVGAYQELTTLTADALAGTNTIQVNDASGFNTSGLQYLCINGTESHRIISIAGNQIQFSDNLSETHYGPKDGKPGEPVFRILAITYSLGTFDGKSALLRDDNIPVGEGGLGPQPVAESIESIRFMYTMNDGSVYWDTVPGNLRDNIRMIQVAIVARTDRTDPGLHGDGYRRRTLTSNIQLRNLIFS